jgi:hypothetical protein
MEFDINKVYGSINADKLKVGSLIIPADNMMALRDRVANNHRPTSLTAIKDESWEYRFVTKQTIDDKQQDNKWALAYLVSEPEEKKLRWTDLKVGDVITNKKITSMVVRIDTDDVIHILAGNVWLNDEELKEWEKVENEKEK